MHNNSSGGQKIKKNIFYIILDSTISSLEGNCNVFFWIFLPHFSGIFPLNCDPEDPVGSEYAPPASFFCPFLICLIRWIMKLKILDPELSPLWWAPLPKIPSSEIWRFCSPESSVAPALSLTFSRTLYLGLLRVNENKNFMSTLSPSTKISFFLCLNQPDESLKYSLQRLSA